MQATTSNLKKRPRNASSHSMFEPLEARQLMTAMFAGPSTAMFLQPIIVNGTPYNDTITVSYSNHFLHGSRVLVKVNPTFDNPGYIVFPLPGQAVQINGLGGHDVIRYSGSMGAMIYGGEGNDTIYGGSGSDYISGGNGSDWIDGGLGADFISGGAGHDTVSYATRTAPLNVRVDGLANDGEAGEMDNIQLDVEALIGGSGNDYLSFYNSTGVHHKLVGNAGNDTLHGSHGPDIIIGGPGHDMISGHYGDDYIIGESGNDVILGGHGRDLISGGIGDDVLLGDDGMDTLYGDEGHDTLHGGADADTLYGGSDNDYLRGDGGNDQLFGDSGDDRLYGGAGSDTLWGGSGNDGLFGGGLLDVDYLNGGSGHDRFLVQPGDIINDRTSTDARIYFFNGQQRTVTFAGQDGSYTFAAGAWTDFEVEWMDSALDVLHKATGNTRLLKKFNRSEISFVRQGQQISSSGGTFSGSAWNGNGQITMVNLSLNTVLHEIGHNFDDEFNSAGWRSLSGWTQQDMSSNSSYQRGTGNDGWWHLRTAQFATTYYARTNPYEDFAESFEANLMNRAGWTTGHTVVAAKNSFMNTMIASLAANA